MKLPAERDAPFLVRPEIVFDGNGRLPPSAAVELVRGFVRDEALRVRVRMTTIRRRTGLHDSGGRLIGGVVDDAVSVLDDGSAPASFRELEVEIGDEMTPDAARRAGRAPAPGGRGLARPDREVHPRARRPRTAGARDSGARPRRRRERGRRRAAGDRALRDPPHPQRPRRSPGSGSGGRAPGSRRDAPAALRPANVSDARRAGVRIRRARRARLARLDTRRGSGRRRAAGAHSRPHRGALG